MVFLFILVLILIFLILYSIGKNELDNKKNLKDLEIKFLIGSANLVQFKDHALKILEIVYDKAGESDPQFIEDYKKIVAAVEEKYEEIGDNWIKELQKTLGYEIEYKNWKQATKYIDRLLKATKYESERP